MSLEISRFEREHEPAIIDLSLRAWAPVFAGLQLALPTYVFEAFYPNGWRERQTSEIRQFLQTDAQNTFVCRSSDLVVGWMGLRFHQADRMGEIHMIAVDPEWQRHGVASLLIDHAMDEMRRAGMEIAMVETGDDPGHGPARATYERAGFERCRVSRYFRQLRPAGAVG